MTGDTVDDRSNWNAPTTAPARPHGGDVRERRLAKFRQNVARFRLYRLRFLQENMRFAAFFKIYQILKLKFLKFDKILQTSRPRRRGPSRGGGLSNVFIVDF